MYFLSDKVLRAVLVPLRGLPWPEPAASANGARLTCYHPEMDCGKPRKMHSPNPS